jgi:hypothetical protein
MAMAHRSTPTPKKKRPSKRDSSTRFTSNAFRPYALLIGQIALAWNDLQEGLGDLFAAIALGAEDLQMTAIWQSAKADRAKRDMLKAAAAEMSFETVRRHPKLEDDISWILARMEGLENSRNNAIHSPLISRDGPIWAAFEKEPGVQPNDATGNTRALQLQGKDLLREFRNCRDLALVLGDYVGAITDALWSKRTAWPERPSLPTAGRKADHKHSASHPKKIAKPADQAELPLPSNQANKNKG